MAGGINVEVQQRGGAAAGIATAHHTRALGRSSDVCPLTRKSAPHTRTALTIEVPPTAL